MVEHNIVLYGNEENYWVKHKLNTGDPRSIFEAKIK